MGQRDPVKRVLLGLTLLCLLAVMHSAEAQRRRLPSRTEPIPDTETGAKAGSTSGEEPAQPRLMIYGPPVAPLGAPPASPVPEAATKPAAEPVAVPAPAAVSVPAAAPSSPPVSRPTPPQPEPMAIPLPPPGAAPVALPPPTVVVPTPPPVASPTPSRPEPVAVPLTAPVVRPTPVVAPPIATPAPAPVRRDVATVSPTLTPGAQRLDPKTVEQIFSCLAPGLPSDWKRTWVVVTNSGAALSAKFYYTSSYRDQDGEEFKPCNAQEVTRRIVSLSEARASWSSARLAIDSEGGYKLDYE